MAAWAALRSSPRSAANTLPAWLRPRQIDGGVITFTDLSSVMRAKQAMGDPLAVLQSRMNNQAAQLDASRTLEGVLQQAQASLESRLAELMLELDQTRRELHGEKRRKL